MKIEVVYASHNEQVLISLDLASGSTAEQAIRQSGILERFPEIDLSQHKIGRFSHPCNLESILREHDRVEIYRPLIADPKEVRRQRVAEGKTMKRRSG